MKFVFENFENHKDFDVATAIERGTAIADNLLDIVDYKDEKNKFCVSNVTEILVDCNDYNDEFYLTTTVWTGTSDWHSRNSLHLEVLTREGAERNELDYMDDVHFTDEDRANYKLGETLQHYQPLGDTGFWYTLK